MGLETQRSALAASAQDSVSRMVDRVLATDLVLGAFITQYPQVLTAGLSIELFVDSVNGSDDNDGLSWDTPLANVNLACQRIPSGAYGKVNLIKGSQHFVESIDCSNRIIEINGNAGVPDYSGEYASLISVAKPSGVYIKSTSISIGRNGFLYIRGCKLVTASYGPDVTNYSNTDYNTAFIKSNSNHGVVVLEHIQTVLNNAPLMYQHSGGSFGVMDIFIREMNVHRTPDAQLTDTRRRALLLGTHGNHPIPFKLYAYRLVLDNVATVAELFGQSLENAMTNVLD